MVSWHDEPMPTEPDDAPEPRDHLEGCDSTRWVDGKLVPFDHVGPCRCRCGKPVVEARPECTWHAARAEKAAAEPPLVPRGHRWCPICGTYHRGEFCPPTEPVTPRGILTSEEVRAAGELPEKQLLRTHEEFLGFVADSFDVPRHMLVSGPQPAYARKTVEWSPPAVDLPWAGVFQRRCKARVEPNESGFWGRCELVRGHEGDHALERGMDCPRWSTRWTA